MKVQRVIVQKVNFLTVRASCSWQAPVRVSLSIYFPSPSSISLPSILHRISPHLHPSSPPRTAPSHRHARTTQPLLARRSHSSLAFYYFFQFFFSRSLLLFSLSPACKHTSSSHPLSIRIAVYSPLMVIPLRSGGCGAAAAFSTEMASATLDDRLSGDSIRCNTSDWSISRSMPVIFAAFCGSIASIIG